jgi:IS30 family transposase
LAGQYKHISLEERALIQTQLELGFKPAAIAAGLKRARSTVLREIRRNGWQSPGRCSGRGLYSVAGGYRADKAHQRACRLAHVPRVTRKLVVGNPLWQQVVEGLGRGLSPEQVAGTLRRMNPSERISHEAIYSAIYAMPRGELRAEVIALLRKARKGRRPRSQGQDRRSLIPNMTSIEERPIEVEDRLVPGHWEGDLIKGANNRSQVGTLVERTTLFTVLAQMDDATALCAARSFAGVLRRIDTQMRLSLTYDQGREMTMHESLTRSTGMKVYFAHPRSPWERGTNENTNGLLRQYLPKGTDLSGFTQADLDQIAFTLNVRPRKALGWKCPAELFLPEGTFDFKNYWGTKLGIPVALEP